MNDSERYSIAVGAFRYSKEWKPYEPTWDQLCKRFSTYRRTSESAAEYARMSKGDRDKAKDHGGFVGGEMEPGQRVKSAVRSRSLVTLDFDNCGSVELPPLVEEALPDTAFAMYTTHSHTPENARWRVIVPLSREVTCDEYVPIARRVAERIGIRMADPTTYQVERLMYWPSCSYDAAPETHIIEGDPLDADAMLDTYVDWHDASSWPAAPGEQPRIAKGKAEDPRMKDGPVGLFCRTYTIPMAIAKFIPGTYVRDERQDDRYTYAGGSSKNGFVVYEGGLIGFSNHATDPVGGKAVNAFDLVRIHKYGHLDLTVRQDTPLPRYPSYMAMVKLIDSDDLCQARLNREQFGDLDPAEALPGEPSTSDSASSPDAKVIPGDAAAQGADWHNRLTRNNGSIMPIPPNVTLIMANDERLKGRVRRNLFQSRDEVTGDLPWIALADRVGNRWSDDDTTQLLGYLTSPENRYSMKIAREMVANSVSAYLQTHTYHPVRDYLNSLPEWEGDPASVGHFDRRWDGNVVDEVLVDFLGAPDTPYVRAVTRKHLVAAVARVMEPGVKYDTAWVLLGHQGLGKSQLFRSLSPESEWLNESLSNIEGKDGMEALRGKWFVELSEMSAMKRSDIETVKAFISRQVDTYRAAYRRDPVDFPRQCVFNLTTNEAQMLKDSENRRFWVVNCLDPSPHAPSWTMSHDQRDLIWSQALWYWNHKESLILPPALEAEARRIQSGHTEIADDPRIGRIQEWLHLAIPDGWYDLNKADRVDYCQRGHLPAGMFAEKPRERVCPIEALFELFGERAEDEKVRWKCREIAKLFDYVPELEREKKRHTDPVYGTQYYWQIKEPKVAVEKKETPEDYDWI